MEVESPKNVMKKNISRPDLMHDHVKEFKSEMAAFREHLKQTFIEEHPAVRNVLTVDPLHFNLCLDAIVALTLDPLLSNDAKDFGALLWELHLEDFACGLHNMSEVAEETEVSINQIRGALVELEKSGYIKIRFMKKKGSAQHFRVLELVVRYEKNVPLFGNLSIPGGGKQVEWMDEFQMKLNRFLEDMAAQTPDFSDN